MTIVGYGALALALAISIYTAVASILGARRGSPKLAERAQKGVMATAVLVTLASAILIYLLITRDFQVEYVYRYVSTYLPTIYTLSAFWAGQEGSLLLWLWLLTIFSVLIARREEGWSQELKPYTLAVLAFCQAFFALLLVFASNPFATSPTRPAEGFGLNPLLENFWMIIHPPVVFIGYAAYTVPFAFAIAALVTGKLGEKWIRGIRRWNLFSWLFLGLGIILGAWWAYLELGWGGYWGWDPVENASLIPWLVGTALLHSTTTQERRGIFKVWNIALIIMTFVLCIFATFVTRSGIIQSVHAFGESVIGYYFLAFLVAVLAVSFGLAFYRRRELASEREMKSLLSREAGFLLNNLLFVGLALAVFIGTVFPTISEIVRGTQVALEASFFERVFTPLALPLVLLIGICPLLGWRQTSSRRLLRRLLYPGIVALALAVVIFVLGITNPFALLSLAVCAFVASSILWEFLRGTMARRRSTGEDYLLAFRRLITKKRRRYGGYLVHLSIVIITVGVIGSSLYQTEYQVTLAEGETVTVKGYTLEHEGLVVESTPGKHRFASLMSVYRGDRKIATLVPEKNFHWNVEQWVTEVAIRTSLKEDLYVILAAVAEDGSATFQILINPLVVWLWIGGGLLLVGTTVALWPEDRQSSKLKNGHRGRRREAGGKKQEGEEAMTEVPALSSSTSLTVNSVEVRGLVKSFGGKMALEGVDLDVAQGEFLTLVGPNGAGKTTVIRILATLTRPTRGSVRVAGCDLVKQGSEVRRHIGLASHQTLLYGDLSAEENLRFYGRMYEVPELEERITALLQLVGLDHRRHDLVRTFSRGMQQRLALARALLHNPAILLLDEPYTGLDQHAAEMLREVLVALGGRSRTVLMTTHNLERGLELCDRAAILVNGRIVHQASQGDLNVASFRKTYSHYLHVSPFDSAQGRPFTFHSGVGR